MASALFNYSVTSSENIGGEHLAFFDKENKKIEISYDDYVIVTRTNNIVEFQYMEKTNNGATIKRLDGGESYVVLSTGEVKDFVPKEHRGENYSGLRRTFKKLRYLINNNFYGFRNELFLTLTYAENMRDTQRLYDDFRKFIMRLKYQYKEFGNIEYIDVVEPQARGAWHHHVLIKIPEIEQLYIPHEDLEKIWGHGFVWINRLNELDNIGAYLTAYLADIPLNDTDVVNGEIVEKEINGVSKKIVKGGRLYLYPVGINLYRKSKGILMPERYKMKYSDAIKIVHGKEMTMSKNIFLEFEDEKNNHIRFEQYNLKRPINTDK